MASIRLTDSDQKNIDIIIKKFSEINNSSDAIRFALHLTGRVFEDVESNISSGV